LPTSGYLLAGTLRYSRDGTYSGSQQDVWLGSGDGVGRLQWLRRYGGSRMQKDVPRYSDTYGSVSLTKDGGALLVGFTDTLTPEGSGLWAMKVPAKDGVIAFDPSTTATTEVVSTEGKPSCFTQQDAPIAPIAH